MFFYILSSHYYEHHHIIPLLQLKPFEMIKIYFYPNSKGVNEELFFYMVHPGEEFFLHMSLWKTVPFGFKLNAKTEFMDLTVEKQVEIIDSSTNECVDDMAYDYVGKIITVAYCNIL